MSQKETSLPFGLLPNELKAIVNVFKKFQELKSVVIFGSRAMGTYHSGSDIDLAVFGPELNLSLNSKILTDLDALNLPYKIDLCFYTSLQNVELKEHIVRVGRIIYPENSEP